jgi:amidase
VSKIKLRLQSGMRCFEPELCTASQGSSARGGYLHQSHLIKDLGFFETGEPATFGSNLFKDFIAYHEAAYVTRCKKAGLVFMGRSSSPEFGLNPNTESRLYGSCHNPWHLEYSAGGSSGGAVASVSAGILPMAHATDGGGSIRIPAAQCGLFGLKPSRGRVSMAPDAGRAATRGQEAALDAARLPLATRRRRYAGASNAT